MSSSKMPISLLRNTKTIGYLHGMFAILNGEPSVGAEYGPLQKKVDNWLRSESKRLDLNENESAMLEESSHTAYRIAKAKSDLDAGEKVFIDQHEFFFKS